MSASSSSGPEQQRQSHGLQQLFASLQSGQGLNVLDIGEFTQANVTYITSLGCRPTFDNLHHSLDSIFGDGDPNITQADSAKANRFLDHALQFERESFDAILIWDVLERLSRPLLASVISRLHGMLRPGGMMLACFHAESKDGPVQTFSFRIADARTLLLHPKGTRKMAQPFSNRSIEKLFEQFSSVKFFLTRDSIREVLVRK